MELSYVIFSRSSASNMAPSTIMRPRSPRSSRSIGAVASWWNDGSGTAAVEFAFVGGLFVLFIAFTIELGLSLFMQVTLDRAVRKEARTIRTGAIKASGQNQFTSNICADVQFLMSCSSVQINVASGSSFSSLSSSIPTNSAERMTTTGFNPGTSGQSVIVQVGYTRGLFFSLMRPLLGNGGNVFVSSSIAFQNEPF